MPELDGWGTLEEMDKRGHLRDIPVVFFTVEKLNFVKILRKDSERIVGYIEKPFSRSDIIETAGRILRTTKKIRRHKKQIRQSEEVGKCLAEAYSSWSRSCMIHRRFLNKLENMEKSTFREKRLDRIRNLKKGEKNTIDELNRKRKEILVSADLDDLDSSEFEL